MTKSIEKSLEYFTKNFGPYYHKEARIIEFPRVAQFAQAFPGNDALCGVDRLHRQLRQAR